LGRGAWGRFGLIGGNFGNKGVKEGGNLRFVGPYFPSFNPFLTP